MVGSWAKNRADRGATAGKAARVAAAETGGRYPGFDRVELHVGDGLGVLDGEHGDGGLARPVDDRGKCEAGRDGSCVAQNEPRALETFTTTGLAERRSRGSAASVTRMMPTAFVSNTSRALGPSSASPRPSRVRLAMPALLTRTSSPPSASIC